MTRPDQGAILDEPLADPTPTDAVVRTLWSGISRGTEALVFAGRVPESEWQRMRAPFQGGRFPAPVKYGYSAVGVVELGPADVLNRPVFCLHPHQTRFVVPAAALHVLPDDVPPQRAVLAANMETAVNGVWDASIRPGDRVTVVGGGTVGCLSAWIAGRIAGCEVTLVDRNPARAATADAIGVRFSDVDDAPRDQDVVIHASGSPDGLGRALLAAGFEATIVELSWFGASTVSLSLGEAFHANRLTIRSSQVGHVSQAQRARWDHRRRMRFALSLLREPELDALVSGESAFDELPELMQALANGRRDALCHRVRY